MVKMTQIAKNINFSVNSRNQKIAQGRSPLTEDGKEWGIELFKTSDYIGKEILVYFPRITVSDEERYDPETGTRLKVAGYVKTRELKRLGTDKYAGVVRDTTGFAGLEEYGISGTNCFSDYLGKVADYMRALARKEVASQYGVASTEELTEEEHKNVWSRVNKFKPIGNLRQNVWIPVVVLEREESQPNQAPKFKYIPLVDENGEPIVDENGKQKLIVKSKVCWFKVSEAAYKKKFADPFATISREAEYDEEGNVVFEAQGEDFEGYLAILNFKETKDSKGNEIKDQKQLAMQLGRDYGVAFLSQEQSKYKNFYNHLGGMMSVWDEQASEHYTVAALADAVEECRMLTDEELQKKIDADYGRIEEETAAILAVADSILAGGIKTAPRGADAVLGGGAPAAQPQVAANNTATVALETDFEWDPVQ